MKIPSNKQWSQDNSGDVLGVLGDSTNMAFDTIGKATLAKKSVSIFGSRDDADYGATLAITYFDDSYVVLTDDEIFQGNLPLNSFTDLEYEPTVGLYSDAVVFNSLYTVTTSTSVYTWNGGALSGDWDDQGVALTSGINHPLAVFGTQCAVGNGNTVKLITTSYTTAQTLTLPTEYRVTTIRAVNNYLYIGTKNLNGGNAKIFVWDGDSSLFNYECEVGANWVYAMTEYLSTVAAITSQGQLGIVNGTTFQELAGLPVYYEPHSRWQGSGGLQINGKVFNRGMVTIGSNIYLNIEGDVDSGFMPEMKSGIWVYDPTIGLYHRASATSNEVVRDSGLTRSGDTLTTSAAHKLVTGDCVVFDTVSGLTGVSEEEKYYVDVISTTEIKLAQTRKALEAGHYVALGGTPTAGDSLVYCENDDYSISDITSGAISVTTFLETPHPNLQSEILWGNRFSLKDGTTAYGLFSFTDSYNIGSFTSQRIYTDNIDQTWNGIYNFIDGIVVSSEEVVVKVQTKYEPPSTELTGVWLNSTTLNNGSAEDFSAWTDIEEGNEVVIIDGYGRGHTAHVTEVNQSSATVSLVLDEAIGTANESCTLYYTTFQKISPTLTRDNKEIEKIKTGLMNIHAPWISVKLELRGFMPSVNMLELANVVHKSK